MYTRIAKYQYSLRSLSATTKMCLQLVDESNTTVSHVLFLDQDNIPTPRLNPNDNKVWIYFHKTDFPNVIDLLRNEDPVYLYFVNDGFATLQTAAEPVGEEEAEV